MRLVGLDSDGKSCLQQKIFVAHPLLVGYDLARREDEADLEDHSEELQHEVVDGDEPQQVVESVHF